MKLIPNWKRAWRYLSVQIAMIVAALAGAVEFIPQLKEVLPPFWSSAAAVAIIVARIIHQPKEHPDDSK